MESVTVYVASGLVLVGVVGICLAIGPSACTDPKTTRRVLSEQGYTGIEVTGWRPMAAGQDDTFSTGFRAKSPSGNVVTGAVTSGWMKGATVRFD